MQGSFRAGDCSAAEGLSRPVSQDSELRSSHMVVNMLPFDAFFSPHEYASNASLHAFSSHSTHLNQVVAISRRVNCLYHQHATHAVI